MSLYSDLKAAAIAGDSSRFADLIAAREREFYRCIGRRQANAIITEALIGGKTTIYILVMLLGRTRTKTGLWPITAADSNRDDIVEFLVRCGFETKYYKRCLYDRIPDNRSRENVRKIRQEQYENFLEEPRYNICGFNYKLII